MSSHVGQENPVPGSLESRVRVLEDDAEIRRLVMRYGPAADAGATEVAASIWAKDGVYDWDSRAEPLRGGAAVQAMLAGDKHQGLIADGVAHVAGPLLIDVNGETATALNYTMVLRREDDRYYLWRVSAVHWELIRENRSWRVSKRRNRPMDGSGAGRELFETVLAQSFRSF